MVEYWRAAGEEWLDLYVQLAIVEGRRQGKVPVLGGIRVVRERPMESRNEAPPL